LLHEKPQLFFSQGLTYNNYCGLIKTMEQFLFACPHCHNKTNAAEVAATLPDEILLNEAARRSGRRQRRHAGPGRPTIVRCPGCDSEMSSAELREHRIQCVRTRLQEIQHLSFPVRLTPKDPDPYPDFCINQITETEVEFRKGSNSDHVTVGLQKVAEITLDREGRRTHIRLLGHVSWHDDIKRWRFAPNQIGRPPLDRAI
jgi:hypothetical protein